MRPKETETHRNPCDAKSNESPGSQSRCVKEEIVEKLADLEHEQWMHWSKSITEQLLKDDMGYNIRSRMLKKHQSWLENWKPYDELSEEVKELDREWAYRVWSILEEALSSERERFRGMIEGRIDELEDRLKDMERIKKKANKEGRLSTNNLDKLLNKNKELSQSWRFEVAHMREHGIKEGIEKLTTLSQEAGDSKQEVK